MQFHNLTPFPGIAYEGIDQFDEEFHVVAMRATFDIIPDAELKAAEDQLPLVVTDEYFGEVNKSSLKQESDLVQYKPKCDVIVIGSAHAPGGKPAARFETGIKISGSVTLDKKLTVTGPRFWEQKDSDWSLTKPEPIDSLPLQYEYAYGGECRVNLDDPAAERVEEKYHLTPEQRQQHPDGVELAPIAHTAYELNPVGKGYSEQWYVDATKPVESDEPVESSEPVLQPVARTQPKEQPVGMIEEISRFLRITKAPAPVSMPVTAPVPAVPQEPVPPEPAYRIAAPQIESPEDPILEFGKQYTPQGFGVITKSWLPRRTLVGTADEEFAKSEAWLPDNFDFAFWNGAHPDLQTEWLKGGERIELKNLHSPGTAGATTDKDGNTIVSFTIPEMKPYIFVRFAGAGIVPYDLKIDTVIIDTQNNNASIVYRTVLGKEPEISAISVKVLSRKDQTTIDGWKKNPVVHNEVNHG